VLQTDGRNGRDDLAQLEFVKDSGFSSGIKTNLQYSDQRL